MNEHEQKQHRCATSFFDLMVSITAKKRLDCPLPLAVLRSMSSVPSLCYQTGKATWSYEGFPLLFWKILTVSTSLWDHCQYTQGYSKINICNASMNAPYICFECLKRFACALTSSSYGPVSDAPCEVSPVLIRCWTLFLHLQICVKSCYSEPRNPAHDMVSVSAAVSSDSVSQQCLWITMPQTQVLSAHFVLTKCCHLFR